jgi:hypothetical protein
MSQEEQKYKTATRPRTFATSDGRRRTQVLKCHGGWLVTRWYHESSVRAGVAVSMIFIQDSACVGVNLDHESFVDPDEKELRYGSR